MSQFVRCSSTFIFMLLLLPGCAKFGFEDLSLLSSSGVTVLGITGGADITQDVYLFDGNIPTVHWIDEPDEDSYEVTIFENDRTTVACPTVALPQNTTSHTFLTCPLVEGRAYYAYVNAIGAAVMGTATQQSFNVDDSFNFLYPSTVIIANSTISEGVGVTAFNVTLSAPSDWPVTIPWSTLDGTAVNSGIFKDYDQVAASQVIITPGNTTADLNITITDDPRDEFDQDLSVNLGSLTHAKMSLPSATITIQDNDPEPTLSLSGAVVTEGDSASVTLSLSVISEKPIDFDYATQDVTATSASGDYLVINPTSVNFSPGSNDVSFMVTSLEDVDVCEFQEDIGIVISGGVNVPDGSAGTVDVQDDDLPVLSIANASAVEGSSLVFTATLSAPCPAHTVTFDYHTVDVTTTNDQDHTAQSGSVTFIPNDVSENITITTIDDGTRDLDSEYITIGARNRTYIDTNFGSAALGEIIDNEVGVATVKVATFGQRTCALSSDGQIKCWGANQFIGYDGGHYGDQPGEMGDNLNAIDFGTHDGLGVTPHTVQSAVTSERASCVLLDDNRVKCWGMQQFVGLEGAAGGPGDQVNELGDNLPYLNFGTHDGLGVTPHSVKQLSGNRDTFCVVLDDDRVKCWGSPGNGAAGETTDPDGQIGAQANEMGDNLPYLDLGTHDGLGVTPHTVKQLSMPCAILDDDRVKCWGGNGSGDLGIGDTENRGDDPGEMGDNLPYVNLGTGRTAKKMSGNCAILDNDRLKCWGYNLFFGQLGIENYDNQGDDPGEMGDSLPYIDLGTHDGLGVITHTVKDISRGYRHTCVILDDDRVKCWGYGAFGRTGLGNTGSVGGVLGDMGDNLTYVDLGTGRTAKSVVAMTDTTAVIRDDDTLVMFGYNRYGQLGRGDVEDWGDEANEMGDFLVPVDLGSGGRHAVSIGFKNHYAFNGNMCAVLNTGELKCWGYASQEGASGEIPQRMKIGDQLAEMGANLQAIQLPTGRTATNLFAGTSIVGGRGAFCAVLDNGNFVCWGSTGTTTNFGGLSLYTGDRPNSLGDNLDQHQLPSGRPIVDMMFVFRSLCALDDELNLYCWGDSNGNQFGQLLNGTTVTPGLNVAVNAQLALVGNNRKMLSVSMASYHSCGLFDDYSVKCWGLNNYGQLGLESSGNIGISPATSGDNLAAVDLGSVSYPVQIKTGESSSCARFANGGVKCWGRNHRGQLGQGHTNDIGDEAGEMGDVLPFISLGGPGETAKEIYMEQDYVGASCAKRSDDSLVCWGSGYRGRLGNGSSANIGDAPGEMGVALVPVDLNGDVVNQYNSGGRGSCALLTNGNVKCWGENLWGQAGQGTAENIGDDPGEMGAALPPISIVW